MCKRTELIKNLNTTMLREMFLNKPTREIKIESYVKGDEFSKGAKVTDISPYTHPSTLIDELMDCLVSCVRFFVGCSIFKVVVVDGDDVSVRGVLAEVERENL